MSGEADRITDVTSLTPAEALRLLADRGGGASIGGFGITLSGN